jgi:hypothetical protein
MEQKLKNALNSLESYNQTKAFRLKLMDGDQYSIVFNLSLEIRSTPFSLLCVAFFEKNLGIQLKNCWLLK